MTTNPNEIVPGLYRAGVDGMVLAKHTETGEWGWCEEDNVPAGVLPLNPPDTPESLVDEIRRTGFVRLRDCSACGVAIGYVPHPVEAAIGFLSSCGCVSYEETRPATWEDLDRMQKYREAENAG